MLGARLVPLVAACLALLQVSTQKVMVCVFVCICSCRSTPVCVCVCVQGCLKVVFPDRLNQHAMHSHCTANRQCCHVIPKLCQMSRDCSQYLKHITHRHRLKLKLKLRLKLRLKQGAEIII